MSRRKRTNDAINRIVAQYRSLDYWLHRDIPNDRLGQLFTVPYGDSHIFCFKNDDGAPEPIVCVTVTRLENDNLSFKMGPDGAFSGTFQLTKHKLQAKAVRIYETDSFDEMSSASFVTVLENIKRILRVKVPSGAVYRVS